MSKKKRKQRSRGTTPKSHISDAMQRVLDERRHAYDQVFQESCLRVREALTRFAPADILIALNIMDLWQPNRAAPIKHQLAFGLLISTPAENFTADRITSFDQFTDFCSALIEAFPEMPMLEDFVPESDWGEVKLLLGHEPVALLHGGTVQRIVDHIEAFQICHGFGTQAATDVESAIRLQAELLRLVPSNGEGEEDRASPGHTEIPPVAFWESMSLALKQFIAPAGLRDCYIAELGSSAVWQDIHSFGGAVIEGVSLPWVGVCIDGLFFPVSLRNAVTVVIDSWAKSAQDFPSRVVTRLSRYIEKRVQNNSCLAGPFWLRSGNECAPLPVAVALTDRSHHFLVVPVLAGQLKIAGKAVAAMRRIMRNQNWGLQLVGTSDGFQLMDDEDRALRPKAVQILLVNVSVSTALTIIKQPSADARLIPLLDACTIFDSIRSIDELARFWRYVESLSGFGGGLLNDLGDLFGSFRDTHAQIIAGAITPDFLGLDPHWGASWRYKQLKNAWMQAPLIYPDEDSAWEARERNGSSSLRSVVAKNLPKLAWSSAIGSTTLNFILDVDEVGLDRQNGSLLELFVHCAADSIAERASIIEPFLRLPLLRVNLHCVSEATLLPTAYDKQTFRSAATPLIANWAEMQSTNLDTYQAKVSVNLARLVQDIESAVDARFEAACALSVVEYLFSIIGTLTPTQLRQALSESSNRQPRFTLNHMQRTVDVPDFTAAKVPRDEDYKIARRDLAILLREQGVNSGKYELDAARALINPTRLAYRDAVHQRIRTLDRESLLRYCVEQHDALIAAFDREELRITQSLNHEVDYDREEALAKAQGKYIRESRNYRYLIESALVLTSPQNSPARANAILSVQAMIDWLFVFYGASDVLHHGIDVGGLNIDDQYIPDVFYSETRIAQEEIFEREMAALRLGVNVTDEDKIKTELSPQAYIAFLDEAFAKDLQFTYSQMMQVLSTLILWVAAGGEEELACGYVSHPQAIAGRVLYAHPEMSTCTALAVIEFLVLKPDQAWRLLGKDVTEGDVPVWEHSKRGSRHTIRPLIELSDGRLLWGAAAVERARRIWAGSIAAGYLPADYPWPSVAGAVDQIKRELEKTLENRAYQICARTMPYSIKGIDFKRRFSAQKFPDVGDFDVLAYQPEDNQWLTVECKYNQPAFCLKDTRRLRDRIFGRGNGDFGQLGKIEKRRNFLVANTDTLRALLGWPEPSKKSLTLKELYVSKDMHFWLRFPPYEVPTYFVQIDTLDAWLGSAHAIDVTMK